MDLTGVWLGESVGITTQTHHWIIVQRHVVLDIYTRWQNENTFHSDGVFTAIMGADNLFRIQLFHKDAYGEILTADSFKVLQWLFSWQDGKQLWFDVLFQRVSTGLQQFEIEFLLQLYEDKNVLKRLTHRPYA
jgi:hypothetical protein